MYGYIYKTTNLVNNKIYIGQKKSSRYLGEEYLGSGKILGLAIKKYGVENFKTELLYEALNKQDLDANEIFYIWNYRNQGYEMYNIANGGEGGDTFSNLPENLKEERRKNLSKAIKISMGKGSPGYLKRQETYRNNPEKYKGIHKGQVAWNKGLTAETDDRVRNNVLSVKKYYKTHDNIWKGKHHTQESRNKISVGMKGKKNGIGNKSNTGKVCISKDNIVTYVYLEELERYISEGWVKGNIHNKGKSDTYNSKKVHDVMNDITYLSLSEASRKTGISAYFIDKCCKRHINYNEYRFEYIEELQ